MSELHRIQVVPATEELFLYLADAAPSDRQVYTCPQCRDTGWLVSEEGARPCACGQQALRLRKRRLAGLKAAMDDMCFANFELNYYAADRYVQPGCTYRQAADKALRAARVFVAACGRGEAARGLYFEGALGSGKTFLAASIAGELLKRGIAARFIVVPEFLQQLRFSYQEREGSDYDEAAIMNQALDAPVLILDDLGAHNSSPWTISKIYTLLNYRLNSRLPCVITTNLKPAALAEELGQRAASRMREMCDRFILSIGEDIRSRKGSGWQNDER